MRSINKITIILLFAVFAFVGFQFLANGVGSTKIDTVRDCKVIKLQQQQIISSSDGSVSTEIRYLIITDKETFICESSLLNGKFNNSDIFWRLKEGETYSFKVCGMGKTALTDYRNVLEVLN